MSAPAARPVWLDIWALALPALVQQGLLLSIQLSDQYLAGPFDADHKAALTTANYVYWFVTSYCVVVNAGAIALVGRLAGARDLATANRAAGQALLLAVAFGALGGLAGVLGLPAFVRVLGLRGVQAEAAADYLLPLAALLPFYMVEVAGIACLVGAGDTRTGRNVLAAVAVVNVPAAYFLSRGGFGWAGCGFVGIAYGTALAHVGGCLVVLATLRAGRVGLKLRRRSLRVAPDLVYRLLRVSLPAAADSLSVGLFQFVFLRIVNDIDAAGGAGRGVAASAHGIAIRIEGSGYLSGAAFATATAAMVARSLGAARPDVAARAAWTALGSAAAVMTGMGVLFFALARPMIELFNRFDPADAKAAESAAAVVAAGVPVLRLIAFAMPGLAGSIVLAQALRAAGDTRVPVLFTWAGFLGVRLPLAWWLTAPGAEPYLRQFGAWLTDADPGRDVRLLGAWLAMFADIYVRGALYLARFAGGRWARVRV